MISMYRKKLILNYHFKDGYGAVTSRLAHAPIQKSLGGLNGTLEQFLCSLLRPLFGL